MEVFDAKFMKNLEKLSPEGLGPPKNRQRWAGLAGLAAQVANVGPMGVQMGVQWRPRGD